MRVLSDVAKLQILHWYKLGITIWKYWVKITCFALLKTLKIIIIRSDYFMYFIVTKSKAQIIRVAPKLLSGSYVYKL